MQTMRLIFWIVFFVVLAAMAVYFVRCNQYLGILLKDPEVVEAIRKAQQKTEEVRACGEPPPDPYTFKTMVSQMDLDLYRQRREAWDRCVQRMNGEGAPAPPSPLQRRPYPHKLREYKESERTEF